MKKISKIIFLFIICLLCFKPNNTKALAQTSNSQNDEIVKVHLELDEYNYDFANEVLRLVNVERQKVNLLPLVMDYDLEENAMLRGAEIAALFSHTRPDGSSYSGIAKVNGENIEAGSSTPEDVVKSWMESSTHKNNILNPNFKSIGIGSVRFGGIYFWSQLFSVQSSQNIINQKGTKPANYVEIAIKKSALDFRVDFTWNAKGNVVGLGKELAPYRVSIPNPGWSGRVVNIARSDFTWTSSNDNITVDKEGNIKGMKLGTSTLYTTLEGKTVESAINVVESITVPKHVVLKVGQQYQIPVTYNPEDSKGKYKIYFGAGIGNFNVNEYTGFLTAFRAGTSDVIVSLSNGYSETCKITVVDKFLKGDVNNDMTVDVKDAREALSMAVGTRPITSKDLEIADFNGNKMIESADAMEILKLYVDKE